MKTQNLNSSLSLIVSNLQARATSDTDKLCKGKNALTTHAVQVMLDCGIDPNAFALRAGIKHESQAGFVAQKAVRRAGFALNAIAQNMPSALPSEIFATVLCLNHYDSNITNELSRCFLSRQIELDELSSTHNLLTKLTRKERLQKGVSTACAQASSLKDMFRLLGCLDAKKHGKEWAVNKSAPIYQKLLTLCKGA